MAREHPESVPEYLPEPPDDAPPALAYGLAHEGVDSDDIVLATLLDLDRPRLLRDEGVDDRRREARPRDQGRRVSRRAPGWTELTAYEQEVLEFFDQLLDGEEVALSEMKDKVPKHSDLWRGRWERMTEKIDAADDGQIGWDRNFNPLRYGIIIVTVALQVIVALFHAADDDGSLIFPLGLAALTFFVLAALPDTWFKRIDRAYVDRCASWRGFRALDRGLPAPQGRPTGDARAVEANPRLRGGLRHRRPHDRVRPDPGAGRRGVADVRWLERIRLRRLVQQQLVQRRGFSSSFASQVAPESSSSGGGGGFSGGGGGGFSGGGGGGSW